MEQRITIIESGRFRAFWGLIGRWVDNGVWKIDGAGHWAVLAVRMWWDVPGEEGGRRVLSADSIQVLFEGGWIHIGFRLMYLPSS